MRRVARERVPASWIFALAVLFVVYFATCGVPRLFDQIDGQYAGAAREMMVRGDWLTPTQDGVPRLQKPPLVYWCEILSLSAVWSQRVWRTLSGGPGNGRLVFSDRLARAASDRDSLRRRSQLR